MPVIDSQWKFLSIQLGSNNNFAIIFSFCLCARSCLYFLMVWLYVRKYHCVFLCSKKYFFSLWKFRWKIFSCSFCLNLKKESLLKRFLCFLKKMFHFFQGQFSIENRISCFSFSSSSVYLHAREKYHPFSTSFCISYSCVNFMN